MAGKILILRWRGSAYDSIGGLLEEIGQELADLGHPVVVFVAGTDDWSARLGQLLQQGDVAFALAMSGVGVDVFVDDNRLLWDAFEVPIFNWNCDHPCYFPSRHTLRSRFVLHGYVFPDHARYNVEHLKPNGMAFAAHMGMPPRRLFPGAPLPPEQRNGRIIFTKSGRDSNDIEQRWRERSPMLRDILFGASEELFHCSTADFLPVLQRRAAGQSGLLLDGDNDLTLRLIYEIDEYIRARRANLVVQALMNHPVDIFGTGWEHLRRVGTKAALHGPLPWREAAFRWLPQYLGCLSINPLVQHSVHDRVFFALSAGVAPLSDENAFSRAHMPELATFCFDFTPDRIVAAAEALLANPADALARTEATFQAMSPAFTLRQAVLNIVQFVGLHEANVRVTV
jgi:hypothetical protein